MEVEHEREARSVLLPKNPMVFSAKTETDAKQRESRRMRALWHAKDSLIFHSIDDHQFKLLCLAFAFVRIADQVERLSSVSFVYPEVFQEIRVTNWALCSLLSLSLI
jgi:hypothetical protein